MLVSCKDSACLLVCSSYVASIQGPRAARALYLSRAAFLATGSWSISHPCRSLIRGLQCPDSPVSCTIVHDVRLNFLGQTVQSCQSAILRIRANACDCVLNTDLGCRTVAPCFQRCQAVDSRTRSLVQANSTCYLGRAGLQSGNVHLVAKPSASLGEADEGAECTSRSSLRSTAR